MEWSVRYDPSRVNKRRACYRAQTISGKMHRGLHSGAWGRGGTQSPRNNEQEVLPCIRFLRLLHFIAFTHRTNSKLTE